MINLKNSEEINLMKHGGKILKKVLKTVLHDVAPGDTTMDVNKRTEDMISDLGGEPGFKKVPKYKWATCQPVNEQVVHTPPTDRVLEDGDILTVDMGVFYKGFHTDAAWTVKVGDRTDKSKDDFLQVGKKALEEALKQVKVGQRIGQISKAIEQTVTKNGYFVIRELTGHGIGRTLHEDPLIPGLLNGQKIEDTPKIKGGMTMAIEVIYSMSTSEIDYEKDMEWSIKTADNSLSACFERTVALHRNETLILT